MAERNIKGYKAHPDRDKLREYNYSAPVGRWAGRLDYLAWGSDSNLFCFFTDVGTGEHYRLSVWFRTGFCPYEGGPAFDQEQPGGLYAMKTARSKKGLPTFLSASRVPVASREGPPAPAAEFNAKAVFLSA